MNKTIKLDKVIKEVLDENSMTMDQFNLEVERYLLKLRIREIRRKAKLTQSQLAKKSGINQDKISKIERGQQNITILTLHKLANAMGKSVRIEIY